MPTRCAPPDAPRPRRRDCCGAPIISAPDRCRAPSRRRSSCRLRGPAPGPSWPSTSKLNENNPSNSMRLDQAEDFVQAVAQATGRLPVVYVHPTWANGDPLPNSGLSFDARITPDSILARCGLWVADYHDSPEIPLAWTASGWRLWQYAGDESARRPAYGQTSIVQGVSHCDRNLFNGDATALTSSGARPPEPADQDGLMTIRPSCRPGRLAQNVTRQTAAPTSHDRHQAGQDRLVEQDLCIRRIEGEFRGRTGAATAALRPPSVRDAGDGVEGRAAFAAARTQPDLLPRRLRPAGLGGRSAAVASPVLPRTRLRSGGCTGPVRQAGPAQLRRSCDVGAAVCRVAFCRGDDRPKGRTDRHQPVLIRWFRRPSPRTRAAWRRRH